MILTSAGFRMHLLDRIDHALMTKKVDADDFERCAQDVLEPIYPGLVPIPGGTDHGRDADVPAGVGYTPIRLMATRAGTLEGVRSNMVRGVKSLRKNNEPVERVLLANLAVLSADNRSSLKRTAKKHDVEIVETYDRVFFADRFRRDGEWRSRLLGIPGDPIAVSRLPPELAESPSAQHLLTGRESELDAVRSTNTDIVLLGVPGSGKTRLLAELDDAVFVDRDALFGTLADDLRMLNPSIVIVDDAGDQSSVLRQLRQVRLQEPDLLTFRLIAVGWPDEADQLGDVLPERVLIELDLLERGPMDEIVRSMGITSTLVRHEILTQAEGRPGWAVALASVLLTDRQPQELLSGRALLGHVSRYLRRRQMGDETADLLATVAALGSVNDVELSTLASTLGAVRPQLASQLRGVARSGLVDIARTSTEAGPLRSYHVRPPMLARALVAERLVDADPPSLDLREVYDNWPDHRGAIAAAVAISVHLGVHDARGFAMTLFDAAFADGQVTVADRVDLARTICAIDADAAQHVLDALRPGFDRTMAESDGPEVAWQLENYVSLAADIARWSLDDAIAMLLDASVVDHRALNSSPGHPLRKVQELVSSFHPELPSDDEAPAFIAQAAGAWLDDHANEPRAWDVYGEAVAATVDLTRTAGAFSDPGNPLTFTIYTRAATPSQITDIVGRVWPTIVSRLGNAPPRIIARLLDAVENWLHLGAGYDTPPGRQHPAEAIAAANAAGPRLLADLAPIVANHPGLTARHNRVAERYDLDQRVQIAENIAPLFQEIQVQLDLERDIEGYRQAIAPIVRPWALDPPEDVCRRIVGLRAEFDVAGLPWPPRAAIVCEELIQQVDETQPWIDAALATGLFPDADAMLRRHQQLGGRFMTDQIATAMTQPGARSRFASAILTDPSAQPDELTAVLKHLDERDIHLLVNLGYASLPDERWSMLLTQTTPPARATAALAYAHQVSFNPSWTPGALTAEWLDALAEVPNLAAANRADERAVLGYVAKHHPDTFISLFRMYWTSSHNNGDASRLLSPQVLEATRDLDSDHKSQLLSQLDHELGPGGRSLVLSHILGTDAGWLANAIDARVISVDDALAGCCGFGPRPPLEDLARVLVPRGAEPEQIAAVARYGTRWGPMSTHYTNIAQSMAPMLDADDPNVVAVARAGIEIYTDLAETEQQNEHQARIRGYT